MKWKLNEKKRQTFRLKSWLTKPRKELECNKKFVFREGLLKNLRKKLKQTVGL